MKSNIEKNEHKEEWFVEFWKTLTIEERIDYLDKWEENFGKDKQ